MDSSRDKASQHRVTFNEQDQAKLYNQAQAGKSQGRIGLGVSSLPKKVAGARWQGKKTCLDSNSEDDEPTHNKVCILLPCGLLVG